MALVSKLFFESGLNAMSVSNLLIRREERLVGDLKDLSLERET